MEVDSDPNGLDLFVVRIRRFGVRNQNLGISEAFRVSQSPFRASQGPNRLSQLVRIFRFGILGLDVLVVRIRRFGC